MANLQVLDSSRGTMRRFLVLTLSLYVPGHAGAADISWDGGAAPAGLDGIFSTVSNWSPIPNQPDRAPGPNDVAHFGTSLGNFSQNAYTVSFNNSPTNQALVVEDDAVTFDLNGNIYTTTASHPVAPITLGVAQPFSFFGGALTIIDGIVVAPFEESVRIGTDRAGSLTVSTGGLLIGAPNISVGGFEQTGTLTVNNGGDIIADGVFIGTHGPAPAATATITGNGSALVAASLVVGGDGNGRLNVTAGGGVESTSGTLGSFGADTGIVNVDGPGSRWINSGSVTVGRFGFGHLIVTGGGRVSNDTAAIGLHPGGTGAGNGSVMVAGINSRWDVNGRLGIGNDPASGDVGGNGAVTIRFGGTVDVDQDTLVYSDDLLWLDGGTLSTTEISFPTSELSITPGTFLWDRGTLRVGRFHGDLTVPNGGVFAPGISLGTSIVFGDYTETPGGKLQIEIGGSPPSFQFDVLEVRGDAVLGGNLQVDLVNGFVPTAANGYAVLTPTGTLSGQFENVASGQRLKTSNGLGSFLVHYGPGSPFNDTFVVVSAYQPLLAGDFNFDNIVNAADYIVWRKSFGQTGVALPGDGNNDGTVDTGDYSFWRAHFGQTAGSGSGANVNATVPEPATLSLIILAAAECLLGAGASSRFKTRKA